MFCLTGWISFNFSLEEKIHLEKNLIPLSFCVDYMALADFLLLRTTWHWGFQIPLKLYNRGVPSRSSCVLVAGLNKIQVCTIPPSLLWHSLAGKKPRCIDRKWIAIWKLLGWMFWELRVWNISWSALLLQPWCSHIALGASEEILVQNACEVVFWLSWCRITLQTVILSSVPAW